jgi:hypothetical protein
MQILTDPAAAAVGRIVSASSQSFETECFQHGFAPPLGTLVLTSDGDPLVYGAVSAVVTQGVDPSRPIAPHGAPDEDLQTVLNRNPHLPILLRTTFDAVIIGHERGDQVLHVLPDLPPQLVGRVRVCTSSEQLRFLGQLDCLEQLLGNGGMGDEVVAAFLRRASSGRPDARAFLLEAGRRLVPLLAAEPERLAGIVRRIRP